MNQLEAYFEQSRSQAPAYAVAGFLLAFAILFPLTYFLAGPAVGVPMGLYESFLFGLAASMVFGVVSGAVAGASELAHPTTRIATVTDLPNGPRRALLHRQGR